MKTLLSLLAAAALCVGGENDFLHWDLKQSRAILSKERVTGTIGGHLGFRGLHTERSMNYKLRATWLSPAVIRAGARMHQLANSNSDSETIAMVQAVEHAADTVFLIEIDPREGSGIVPSNWTATLDPVSKPGEAARHSTGIDTPGPGRLPALSSGARRDYDYDVFWVAFSLHATGDAPLFLPTDTTAELTVKINDQVGKVRLPIPDAFRIVHSKSDAEFHLPAS